MDMKKRVSLELSDRNPAEVCDLVVANCRSANGHVEGLTADLVQLEVLTMLNANISSLDKLPALPRLRKLDLSDNQLCDGLDCLVLKVPDLVHLNLSGNKITELSSLQGLKNLKNLKNLDLSRCDITKMADYRQEVFKLLPQVDFLDGSDRHDNRGPQFDREEDEAGPPDDDDDDDEDDEDDEGSEEEDDDEVGLSYLMKDSIQDEEDDGDYVEEDDDEEEEDDDGDEDGAGVPGEKRKRDIEDEGDDDDDE